jgi:mono/diheme cytochrome c family protein
VKRLAIILLLSACQPHLNRQPKVGAYVASEFFANGAGARTLPAGVAVHPGKGVSELTLAQGRALYDIHCSACHGLTGGGGLAGARGFLNMPSLNTATARARGANSVAEIIEKGQRRMYAMGNRIPPVEARAIARYLHTLQRSQYFPANALPAPDLANLEGGAK